MIHFHGSAGEQSRDPLHRNSNPSLVNVYDQRTIFRVLGIIFCIIFTPCLPNPISVSFLFVGVSKRAFPQTVQITQPYPDALIFGLHDFEGDFILVGSQGRHHDHRVVEFCIQTVLLSKNLLTTSFSLISMQSCFNSWENENLEAFWELRIKSVE